jgi:hypothetical protein
MEKPMSTYQIYHMLVDTGFDPIRVSRAIDVLHGTDERSEADWDEYARIAEWQDRLEAMHQLTDEDLRSAGLSVG